MVETTSKALLSQATLDETDTLRKCSRCKSTLLPEYFSKNRKGEYFKCCNVCKNNKKVKTVKEVDEEYMNKARNDWIHDIIDKSNGQFVYLGPFDPNDVNFPHSKLPQIRGDEDAIEYHAFGNMDTKDMICVRWRAILVPNLTRSIIINTEAAD